MWFQVLYHVMFPFFVFTDPWRVCARNHIFLSLEAIHVAKKHMSYLTHDMDWYQHLSIVSYQTQWR
jgi:hypothetical protein